MGINRTNMRYPFKPHFHLFDNSIKQQRKLKNFKALFVKVNAHVLSLNEILRISLLIFYLYICST